MEKSIFRVGDKVFHQGFGWGEVRTVDGLYFGDSYPVEVTYGIFEHPKLSKICCYTLDGLFHDDDLKPSLSFTEYNFTTGGFSQTRPEPDFKQYEGKWGKFWWDSYKVRYNDLFVIAKLNGYSPNQTECPFNAGSNSWYQHFEPFTDEQIKALNLE